MYSSTGRKNGTFGYNPGKGGSYPFKLELWISTDPAYYFIPARHSYRIRMNFSAGIHPCMTFLANQDESLHWNSSLHDISIESGWISPLKIIPAKHFLQIRMNFSAENHPCMTFLSNQDEFLRWKSSLLWSDHCQETITGNFRLRQATFVFLWQRLERALI